MNEHILTATNIERALLGAFLLDNGDFHEAAASLQASDLSLSSHRIIYAGVSRMVERGAVCDISTLPEELRRTNELESVGGYPYLCDLTNDVPRHPPIGDYVATLKEKAARRALGLLGEQLAGYALDSDLDAGSILDSAEARMLEIRGGQDAAEGESFSDNVAHFLRAMHEERDRPEDLLGLSTGIPIVDTLTRGYQPGEFSVIGGGSGSGKSSLLIQAAIEAASQGVPALLFSLEMSQKQLFRRMAAMVAGVPFSRFRDTKRATAEHMDRLNRAALTISEWPLHVVDDSGLSIERLVAKARLAIRRHGVRLIGVDYIQIVGAAGRDERLRVSAISRGLCRLAKDEGVPVVALSQLSRPDRSNANRRPVMSDLRESSQLENDAHCIVLIHRERDEEGTMLPESQLIIAKQRSGETGTVPVRYSGSTLTFEAREPTREPIQFATRPQSQRGA